MTEFQFVRSSGHYMFDYYLPAICVVVISLISFPMSADTPGLKVGIPIASLFAMLFLSKSINQGTPKISYIKAIDVHTILCTTLIFLVVIGKIIQVGGS